MWWHNRGGGAAKNAEFGGRGHTLRLLFPLSLVFRKQGLSLEGHK